jgi:hypothetical protein
MKINKLWTKKFYNIDPRCPYCYYRNGNESNNRRHVRKHEDVIAGGVDSHWNPFSPLGSVAVLKEKLRPLHEIRDKSYKTFCPIFYNSPSKS